MLQIISDLKGISIIFLKYFICVKMPSHFVFDFTCTLLWYSLSIACTFLSQLLLDYAFVIISFIVPHFVLYFYLFRAYIPPICFFHDFIISICPSGKVLNTPPRRYRRIFRVLQLEGQSAPTCETSRCYLLITPACPLSLRIAFFLFNCYLTLFSCVLLSLL